MKRRGKWLGAQMSGCSSRVLTEGLGRPTGSSETTLIFIPALSAFATAQERSPCLIYYNQLAPTHLSDDGHISGMTAPR